MAIDGQIDPNAVPPTIPEQQAIQPAVQQKKPFDPTSIQRTYSKSQWTMKEDYYTQQCNNIIISDSPTPAEVQQCAVRIDTLLSMARIDYAYTNQQYDRYSMQLKIEEKRLFVDLKISPPSQYNTLKLTVDEMKGVVASVILGNKWGGTSFNLYELVEMSSSRNIFMEAIIKILQDKKDLLITHSGMLKIENSLNGMQPNVPNNLPQNYKHSMED